MFIKTIYIIIFFAFFGCNNSQNSFTLNEKTYDMWRDYIKPTKLDLAWTGIPWRSSFQEGLIESGIKQKPMLMWAMNGHPLGCT